jgi:hypothetical protein
MTNRGPIDGRDPTFLLLVVLHDTIDPEFVGPALVIGVIHVKGKDHSLPQLNRLFGQVILSSGAR